MLQVEPDNTASGGAETPSNYDAEDHLRYSSALNHLAGQPVRPAQTRARTIFPLLRRQPEPQAAPLSVVHLPNSGQYQVRVGAQAMPMLFDAAELRADGVHGVVGPRRLAFRVAPLDAATVASTMQQRQAGESAQQRVAQTKPAMIEALRWTAHNILARYGARDIVRDKREGISCHTYGVPDSATFDFTLGGSNVSLYFTDTAIDVLMSAGDTPVEQAYQVAHSFEMDRAPTLAAINSLPSFFEGSFEAMRAAQTFPHEIATIYELQGMRHFAIGYGSALITEALPLVLDLLSAPIDANHSLLTPYYNGISIPVVHLEATGPRTVRATIVERNGERISTDYTLGADGILERPDREWQSLLSGGGTA